MALRGVARLALFPCRLFFLRLVLSSPSLGVYRRQGLVEVFEGQLKLVGRQPLGAPAELVALQLYDDGAQSIPFGARAVKLFLVIIALHFE